MPEWARAWNEGYDAYNLGQNTPANPYQIDTPANYVSELAREWLAGWTAAAKDAQPATE